MAMVTIRQELAADAAAREALLDLAYGSVRFSKPSERLRAGRKPADGLSFVAAEGGRLVGTVRLWEVSAGSACSALLLGPLAVHSDSRHRGIGSALMRHALREARRLGHGAVLLVGNSSYYGRFGFSVAQTGGLWLPGLHDRSRLLGIELRSGALEKARGPIRKPNRPVLASSLPAVAERMPKPRATAA
jgi:predicted N-acetyltransferase YhbS